MLSHEEWLAEGRRRFGHEDIMRWRFVCPVCGHVASPQDWEAAGAPANTWAFSCIGRYLPTARDAFRGKGPGPCNYAGGGLFKLNPIEVGMPPNASPECHQGKTVHMFAFAEAP